MDELGKKRPLEASEEEELPSKRLAVAPVGEEKEAAAASSSSCDAGESGFPGILELEQEEEDDEDERGIQQKDVTDVMRSLERELGVVESGTASSQHSVEAAEASSSSSRSQSSSPSPSRPDLGFLLEASDDELGIGDSGSGSGLDCVDEAAAAAATAALVEEEDLARGDSWSDGDWVAACCGLEDEQQWVRRSVEMFLASPSCSAGQPGGAFEAAPLLIEL